MPFVAGGTGAVSSHCATRGRLMFTSSGMVIDTVSSTAGCPSARSTGNLFQVSRSSGARAAIWPAGCARKLS